MTYLRLLTPNTMPTSLFGYLCSTSCLATACHIISLPFSHLLKIRLAQRRKRRRNKAHFAVSGAGHIFSSMSLDASANCLSHCSSMLPRVSYRVYIVRREATRVSRLGDGSICHLSDAPSWSRSKPPTKNFLQGVFSLAIFFHVHQMHAE